MASSMAFVGTSDLSGILRGRSLSATGDALFTRGVGWVPANLALTSFGTIAEPNAFGAVGDLRLMPVHKDGVRLPEPTNSPDSPGSPAAHLFLGEQRELDGTPWASCPRQALARVLTRFRDAVGLEVVASFEHEFTLRGIPDTPPMSLRRLRTAEPFGADLLSTLETAGLEPETWLPEYGASQYEITLAPAPALLAADRAILLREIVRDTAARHGLGVSFAPLPAPGQTGNGLHIHLSLRDRAGRPALYAPDRPGRLSALGAKLSAGILAHHRAVLAFTTASPSSYLRLQPHQWSSAAAFLGERNREAMLRICPTTSLPGTDAGAQFNIEFRAADATSNSWLALAAILAAGLEGVLGDLGEATVHPPDAADSAIAAAPRFPESLDEAIDALEADQAAQKWFDPVLLDTYATVKRAESELTRALDPAGVCAKVADVH